MEIKREIYLSQFLPLSFANIYRSLAIELERSKLVTVVLFKKRQFTKTVLNEIRFYRTFGLDGKLGGCETLTRLEEVSRGRGNNDRKLAVSLEWETTRNWEGQGALLYRGKE